MTCLKVAREKGYTDTLFFVDDGITGTTMKRPGFQKMLTAIEAGYISAVFVKDLSRVGRNYIEVGKLTEEFFPQYDVRLVAVSDGVDSDEGDNEFTPFRNIMKDKIRIGIQNDLKLNLSRNSFRHLSRLNMSYFDEKNDAEILNNLRMDIENICMVADNSLFFVFAQIFSIIGGMVGLFILNAKLAGLVVLLIPIKYLIARYFAKQNKKIMQQYIMSEEVYSKWFGDVVSGMREIKLFNLYQHKYAEFQDYQENIVENSKKANLLLTYNMTTEKVIMQILMSCIYILGAIQVFNLETSVGTTFAFISYSACVTSPITAIMNIKQMLAGIFPSVERYVAFINIEEEQVEGEKVPSMGDITLTNVSMCYETNPDKYAIENLSLTIKAGSKTAVIGTNGSGKSTFVNLLLRLYKYSSGSITMNDMEVR